MKRTNGYLAVGAAAVAYLVAVTQRSTMGSASLQAAERFHTNAEQLSSLAVLQIIVYAAMQIPVGFLLDRFGPRILLIGGALAMGSGQVIVAFSDSLSQAITGRIMVGLGDAFTFISMIRIINGWYSGQHASRLQQWLGALGQLGQVLSAIPFSAFLVASGWQSAFLGVSAASVLAALLVFIAATDERVPTHHLREPLVFSSMAAQFRENLANPGVRFAFWVHFSTQSAATVFVLLWGFPFLERAESLDKPVASALISSMVFVGLVMGAFYGWFCGAHPHLRYRMVLVVASSLMATWAIVLLWPGQAPIWLLATLIAVLGGAGPASMVAFDFSRAHAPLQKLGSANGIVNIGGFLATFVTMYFIGVVLDAVYGIRIASGLGSGLGLSSGSSQTIGLYDLQGFKVAMWIQIIVIAVGMFGLRREFRKLAALSSH